MPQQVWQNNARTDERRSYLAAGLTVPVSVGTAVSLVAVALLCLLPRAAPEFVEQLLGLFFPITVVSCERHITDDDPTASRTSRRIEGAVA